MSKNFSWVHLKFISSSLSLERCWEEKKPVDCFEKVDNSVTRILVFATYWCVKDSNMTLMAYGLGTSCMLQKENDYNCTKRSERIRKNIEKGYIREEYNYSCWHVCASFTSTVIQTVHSSLVLCHCHEK